MKKKRRKFSELKRYRVDGCACNTLGYVYAKNEIEAWNLAMDRFTDPLNWVCHVAIER